MDNYGWDVGQVEIGGPWTILENLDGVTKLFIV